MNLKAYLWILTVLAIGLVAFTGYWLGYGSMPPNPADRPSGPRSDTVAAKEPERDAPRRPARATPPDELTPPKPVVVQPAIVGRVTDVDGVGIPGAAVAAYHPDRGALRTTTDEHGQFSIGPMDVLAYRLSASHAAYNEAVVEGVETGNTPIDLVLTPASRATGWVEDAAGNPITDFDLVYVQEARGDAEWWREVVGRASTPWASVSNPEGYFEVTPVASGVPFALGARAPGCEPAFVTVPPAEPGEAAPPARIQLKREARIQGQVLSPDRTPVAGATIHWRPDPEAPVIATCDADGLFELTGLGDGPIELTATAAAFLPATVDVQPRRAQTVHTEIVMGLGGTIQGNVTKGDVPAAGQTVIVSRRTPPQVRKEVSTDENGHYRVVGVDVGEVDVLAKWADTTGTGPQRVHQVAWVEPGQTTVVDFIFAETDAALEGWITANGAPLTGAELRGTIFLGESRSYFSGAAGEDGFYRIENIAPGPAWLEVTSATDGSELKQNVELTLVAGQTVQQDINFDLATGVQGRVEGLQAGDVGQVMAISGGAEIDLSSAEGVAELSARSSGGCDIAEDGSFAIDGLQAGRYTIVAIVFSGTSDTGDDVFDTTRVATQTAAVPGAGQTAITLTLGP